MVLGEVVGRLHERGRRGHDRTCAPVQRRDVRVGLSILGDGVEINSPHGVWTDWWRDPHLGDLRDEVVPPVAHDAVAGGGRMDAVASLSQQRCPVLCEVDSDDVFSCGSARLHSLRNQRLVILRARGALSEQGSNMGAGNIQLRLRSSAGVDDHGDEDHSVGSEITHEWVEPMGTRV